jgi:hypothetical protein
MGGRDETWQELSSVEVYYTQTKEWHSLANMTTPRFGCGATRIASSQLLVAGGYNGTTWLNTAEIYDYEMDTWSTIASMPAALKFCVATTLGADHVLVSGRQGERGTPLFCYTISQDKWTTLKTGSIEFGAIVAVQGKLLSMGNGLQDGGSKNTCLLSTTRLLGEHDDMTVSTASKSSSTSTDPESSSHNRDVQSELPWWFASPDAPKVVVPVIPEHEIDQISVLDDDFCSTAAPSVNERPSLQRSNSTYSFSCNSSKTSKRRIMVENEEIMDVKGQNIIFTGSMSSTNHRPHGKGKLQWIATGDSYNGSFRHGMRDGFGHIDYANGDTFEGWFQKDQRHGRGLYHHKKDGRTYEGQYEQDIPNDPNGTMSWKDGTVYVGSFVQGQRTGKGIQRFASGVRYQGDFVRRKYDGFGVCEFADGSVYKGEWRRGRAHGQGRLINTHGHVIYEGKWKNDGPAATR